MAQRPLLEMGVEAGRRGRRVPADPCGPLASAVAASCSEDVEPRLSERFFISLAALVKMRQSAFLCQEPPPGCGLSASPTTLTLARFIQPSGAPHEIFIRAPDHSLQKDLSTGQGKSSYLNRKCFLPCTVITP
ncbi:hypothetical protein NDU88_002499 [Pleurodeles waltl]|uniref:Uncharacterized protein n=1 Tax=Pleurodeles waltl TaxID=8319 RepID=A0AAV7T2S4_PLEWA|nr:hypothetical protein NDU88_002499 [Pleurodeles waltl]